MKIFLEKNRSVLSNNIENYIDVDLENKNRLLPDESLVDNFSIYGQYIKERDECCNYRVILNVNPVCSNVLFNSISELSCILSDSIFFPSINSFGISYSSIISDILI